VTGVGAAEVLLIVALLLIAAFGLGALFLNRYEIGNAGGMPARLDRLTGRVIGCIPGGCLELIPAGEPVLHDVRQVRRPLAAPSAEASGNAATAPAGAQAGEPNAPNATR
jgi:hypothetical protein